MKRSFPLLALSFALATLGCTDDGGGEDEVGQSTETGVASGDGDGDPTGDGDGDPTTTTTTTTGDGDGDPTTGDGDGDPTTGDGDGDTGGMGCGEDPGWGTVQVGEPVKHVLAKDQTGATVNLSDWCGQPIALDAATVWCGPCQAASQYLSTGQGQDPFGGLGPGLKAAIDAGNIRWITALLEDANGGPGTLADGTAWDMQFPNPNIPVLTEDDVPMLGGYLPGNCVPRVFVIDPDMNFWALDDCQTWNHLGDMVNMWGG